MKQFLLFSNTEIYLLASAGILFMIQVLYYLISYMRPYRMQQKASKKAEQKETVHPPVTVIVYAKNESENLKRFLYTVLQQDYPEYQVVVVNDGSTDESDDVLKRYENQYPHLYHTYIPEDVKYLSRKKLALTVGIKAAKYDILLFTEANCRPLSKNWITVMARNFTEETEIVLGFCAYENKKGYLHKLASYDNLLTGLQYLSSALIGKPFMGSGKNLAYRKQLFFKNKGFSNTLNLHAGDDDLFVNQFATKQNTKVEYSKESITQIAPYEKFKVWKEMKVSQAATRKYYRGSRLTVYRFGDLTRYLFLISVMILVGIGIYSNPVMAGIGILFYLLYFLVQAIVFRKSSDMLQQKPFTGWLPLLDIVQPIYSLYIRFYRLFRGKNDYTFRLGNK
ncbi:glycosyltransferase [Parabacteroides pacaensis]|uniref:glycosyltransferase n=1 Tax=Parabacteroides pacaensis TaxID=2086575 RepID=UPI000D0F73FE|nr:glycosyltransferase [Parabacteroides pacaensis]